MDAELLLTHLTGHNKAWFLAHLEDDLPLEQAVLFRALIARRLTGEPIQYITGQTEFYGLPFSVTPAVLIPRPETEHLVEQTIALATTFGKTKGTGFSPYISSPPRVGALAPEGHPRILDIGTGSGCIAVALAHHLPRAAITAIDLSPDALALARQNAALNKVAKRIRFLPGDLLALVAGESFDIILSNPPYVPTTDRATLSVEVRDHEPALALFAGNDGLDIYRRLIPAAHAALVPGGFLALEIGYGQQSSVTALLTAAAFTTIESLPDLQGIPAWCAESTQRLGHAWSQPAVSGILIGTSSPCRKDAHKICSLPPRNGFCKPDHLSSPLPHYCSHILHALMLAPILRVRPRPHAKLARPVVKRIRMFPLPRLQVIGRSSQMIRVLQHQALEHQQLVSQPPPPPADLLRLVILHIRPVLFNLHHNQP